VEDVWVMRGDGFCHRIKTDGVFGTHTLSKHSFEALGCRLLSLGEDMQRREFITLLGSAAAAWPLAAWAQQPARMRRIGVLMPEAANDAQSPARSKAFEQGLVQLGRVPGRDIEIEYRWADGDIERARVATTELLALKPDAIVAVASMALKVVKQATSTIPVIFVAITEPVAQGFVASLARPGGNLTGFTFMEVTFAEKWIELLKEIAPGVTRGAVMFNPDTTGNFAGFVRTAEAVAQKFAMELTTAPVRQLADVETAMTTLAREPGGGLVLLPDPFIVTNRKAIIEAATPPPLARDRRFQVLRRRRSPCLLRRRCPRFVPAGSGLRRSDPQGREARRFSGAAAGQVRAGHQSQHCQGAQADDPTNAARQRRRGDRVNAVFVAHIAAHAQVSKWHKAEHSSWDGMSALQSANP
jgi:putative ABC transport system substrate-binding protein